MFLPFMLVRSLHIGSVKQTGNMIRCFSQPSQFNMQPIPVTVLSGFLGAGKTSFLSKTLENASSQGETYGLIVNDMASINIDSKVISKQIIGNNGVDSVELQNGCVCCTLGNDMLNSVLSLTTSSEENGKRHDHIIIECSGIAEPRNIRQIFGETEVFSSPIYKKVKLDTMITLVDVTVFLELFGSSDILNQHSRLVNDDINATDANDDNDTGMREVTDLLLEQVEYADVVIINKCDLLKSADQLELVKKIIEAVNPTCKIFSSIRGEVKDSSSLIGFMGKCGVDGVAKQGFRERHQTVVTLTEYQMNDSLSLNNHSSDVADKNCNDDHSHQHHHANTHSHDHDHTCNDPSHDHSHVSHEHSHTCNDPTHDHSHIHNHQVAASSSTTTAKERFGITSLVYRRRKPFHPIRFSNFLKSIMGKLSIFNINSLVENIETNDNNSSKILLRSKGFVWVAHRPDLMYMLSHAGKYCEVSVKGMWWADIPTERWPENHVQSIMLDFELPFGDKRQELVLIGLFDDVKNNNASAISTAFLIRALDACLLTEKEMGAYEYIFDKFKIKEDIDNELQNHFDPEKKSIL
eukprot:gene7623-10377_t